MLTQNFPFLFFGAGEIDYNFHIEALIFFEKPMDDASFEKIKKLTPPPVRVNCLQPNIRVLQTECFESEIITSYEDLTVTQLRDPWIDPPRELITIFNKNFEKWLLEIHKIQSIRFVFRQNQPTIFNEWHDSSMASFPNLINQIASEVKNFDDTEENMLFFAIQGILNMGTLELPELPASFLKFVFPLQAITTCLESGDIEQAVKIFILSQRDANFLEDLEKYFQTYSGDNPSQILNISHFIKKIIADQSEFMHRKLSLLICFSSWAFAVKEYDLLESIAKFMSNHIFTRLYLNIVFEKAYNMRVDQENFSQAIPLYLLASCIDAPNPEDYLKPYSHALYSLIHDNNKMAVNVELNRFMLKRCLPYGEKDPAIFYNAACLYAEMNETELAFDCIQKAYQYRENFARPEYLENLFKEVEDEKSFEKLRTFPAYREWKKQLK